MLKDIATNPEDPYAAMQQINKKVGVSAAGRKNVKNNR